ncbi:TadE family protein [uncultured Cellulomonas sp.]|uniref:TadE family protein n=1 Tax=uncultured Cellulomonas sp. TaxID=189682 RepID=UPI002632DE09|nr:TadE family protein [uncultured Cellulomonas sp.]
MTTTQARRPRVPRPPWAARLCPERGSASVEAVILYPAVLLLLFAIVQGGVYAHARNVARDVANGAVIAARSQDATAADGISEGTARLERAGGASLITGATVQVERGPATVTVTVTGSALSILPGVSGLPITQTASGAVERFVP